MVNHNTTTPIISTISATVGDNHGPSTANPLPPTLRPVGQAEPSLLQSNNPIIMSPNAFESTPLQTPITPNVRQRLQSSDGISPSLQSQSAKKPSFPTIISGLPRTPGQAATPQPPVQQSGATTPAPVKADSIAVSIPPGTTTAPDAAGNVPPTGTVVTKQTGPKRIVRKVPKIPEKAERVLYCLRLNNPIRRLCINIVEWKYPFLKPKPKLILCFYNLFFRAEKLSILVYLKVIRNIEIAGKRIPIHFLTIGPWCLWSLFFYCQPTKYCFIDDVQCCSSFPIIFQRNNNYRNNNENDTVYVMVKINSAMRRNNQEDGKNETKIIRGLK